MAEARGSQYSAYSANEADEVADGTVDKLLNQLSSANDGSSAAVDRLAADIRRLSGFVTGLTAITLLLSFTLMALLLVLGQPWIGQWDFHSSIGQWNLAHSSSSTAQRGLASTCLPQSSDSGLHNAYILSNRDERYNWSTDSLQRGFPGFFDFHRIEPVPLHDPRVSTISAGSIVRSQKVTIIDVWELFAHGAATSCLPDDAWMFFFEDDINVWSGLGEHFDFGPELQRLMNDSAVREDGMLYLGKCGGLLNATQQLRHDSVPPPGLVSVGGYGVCNHALAFTKWRAARMAADIGLWLPSQPEHMDQTLNSFVEKAFGVRGRWPMVFGGAVEPVQGTGHHGVVYQDRARWPPHVTWN